MTDRDRSGTDRADRLAAALRANLRRRKVQGRARSEAATETETDTQAGAGPADAPPAGDGQDS